MSIADDLKALEASLSAKRATHHALSNKYITPPMKRGPQPVVDTPIGREIEAEFRKRMQNE